MITKGITKSKGRKHGFDKFYTKPEIAQQLIGKINLEKYTQVIEPSAGNGAFSNQIENCIALDIKPENPKILQQDFLFYNQNRDPKQKILVIGNPPFGQQNNLAIKFINHAAQFADTVAFILPRSFQKQSLQERVDKHLHLISSETLAKNSFLLDDENYDVPCIFQVWEWRSTPRRPVELPSPVGFEWVKKDRNPDLYIQRIGGNAGKSGLDWEEKNPQSHYFIKATTKTPEAIIEQLKRLKFPNRFFGVGPRSISRAEILVELQEISSPIIKK